MLSKDEEERLQTASQETNTYDSEKRWLDIQKENWDKEKFNLAYEFYTSTNQDGKPLSPRFFEGSETGKINEKKVLSHLDGINFNQDVERVSLQPGTVLFQYKDDSKQIGQYFTIDADKSELGIQGDSSKSQEGRQIELFVVKEEVEALKSTASDIQSWSNGELNYGGGTQYYFHEKDIKDGKVDTVLAKEESTKSAYELLAGNDSKEQLKAEKILPEEASRESVSNLLSYQNEGVKAEELLKREESIKSAHDLLVNYQTNEVIKHDEYQSFSR